MSAPEIKGWCPGALNPMLSGDGWLVRLRPRLGRLEVAQARGIATLAARHGSGMIDLSTRANLQLRGVREAEYPALIEGLRVLGLVDDDAMLEARRNILVSPFWCEGDVMQRLAGRLETALAAPDAPALPAKFGFALDCGESPVLGDISADIRLEAVADGLICRADGAERGCSVNEAEAVPAMLDLARWFLASSGAPEGRGRMKRHLAGGATLPPDHRAVPCLQAPPFEPAPGLVAEGALVGLAFGQIDAETFHALAASGPLRLTPWRMLLIEGAAVMPDLPGLITRGDDPLRRVVACTGAPGCFQAKQETRGLARALAPLIPMGGLLHVSGCAKGCAHPSPAPLTFTGTAAGFSLIRDGDAAAPPAATGLAADPAVLSGFF